MWQISGVPKSVLKLSIASVNCDKVGEIMMMEKTVEHGNFVEIHSKMCFIYLMAYLYYFLKIIQHLYYYFISY